MSFLFFSFAETLAYKNVKEIFDEIVSRWLFWRLFVLFSQLIFAFGASSWCTSTIIHVMQSSRPRGCIVKKRKIREKSYVIYFDYFEHAMVLNVLKTMTNRLLLLQRCHSLHTLCSFEKWALVVLRAICPHLQSTEKSTNVMFYGHAEPRAGLRIDRQRHNCSG